MLDIFKFLIWKKVHSFLYKLQVNFTYYRDKYQSCILNVRNPLLKLATLKIDRWNRYYYTKWYLQVLSLWKKTMSLVLKIWKTQRVLHINVNCMLNHNYKMEKQLMRQSPFLVCPYPNFIAAIMEKPSKIHPSKSQRKV